MSEHEFWNELGNLYYLTGAYEPAIHAYARSIQLNRKFGRPYSNMALAFVQTGKYEDAIDLYHRSIELLTDAKERAITWNRLGILYRQVKDYHGALVAFEQADKLDARQDDLREEASREATHPLFNSLPAINLQAILEGEERVDVEEESNPDPNDDLEQADPPLNLQWFDQGFVPPDPATQSQAVLSEEQQLVHDVNLSLEEGWIPLELDETNPAQEPPPIEAGTLRDEMGESVTSTWPFLLDEAAGEGNDAAPSDAALAGESDVPAFEDSPSIGIEPLMTIETQSDFIDPSSSYEEEESEETQMQDQTAQLEEVGTGEAGHFDSVEVTEPQSVEYAQVEYPLVELSAAEVNSIQIDIARFKRTLEINPRNAFAWDTLGGLYKTLGQFKDAITCYQQAIAIDSTRPSYFYQLGLMYAAVKRDQEAVEAFQKVLMMEPDHTLANASLGSHYRKMGLTDLAQKHIEIALKDVYAEENEYNQACLEAICGNTERALELLRTAIEDNPSYANWAQHDPDLDPLRQDHRFHMLLQSHAYEET